MVYSGSMKHEMRTMNYVAFALTFFVAFVPLFAFAFEAAPYAATMQPTFITEKSIQLNGLVNPNGMDDTYEWFEWGISGRSDVYETNHNHLWSGNWQVNTNATIVGLAPATQYFYRQIAENGRGKNIGPTTYVTTKPLPVITQPIALVTTNESAFVDDSGATLRGYVSPHGNTQTKIWFEWGITQNVEYRTPDQGSWGNSGPVEAKLNQLMPGTAYYFRVVAESAEGRSYGVIRVFTTSGTKLQSGSEAPRNQYVPTPTSSGEDKTSRTTTTSGAVNAPQVDANGLPQAQNRPGDFFSMLFGGKKNANTSSANAEGQVAGVAASGFLSNGGVLTGKKNVEVVVGKIGPDNVISHTPVEYRIAYAYRLNISATNAKLKIILPGEVVYIGDNTNNELLLQAGSGSERTYILPLGKISNGSTRTISILGMTTGDAKGFPDAVVELDYTDKTGTHVVGATSGVLSNNTNNDSGKQNAASVANSGIMSKILPTSILGWMFYILIVIGTIFGIRMAKTYYLKRKELLAKEEQGHSAPSFLPGAEVVTPQGVS